MRINESPHRRQNPLTGEWILVSPHRTKRPWQGKVDEAAGFNDKTYDPECYLCPGNSRSGGEKNPDYKNVYSFVNDFPALLPETEAQNSGEELFKAESDRGTCKVLCFSPRHDLTMALMSPAEILNVVELWTSEYETLSKEDYINYVQIFENRGAVMGCSNMHPHGQLWCNERIPTIPAAEDIKQSEYFSAKGGVLLDDYLNKELLKKERLVWQNDSFAALVPFWAIWPYEIMTLPKKPVRSLLEFDGKQKADLAEILNIVSIKFDNLFRSSFPYSMGLHQAPTDGKEHPHWQFHIHYYPPLLRSASVRKFMVGYELLASPQRDITPEQSAEILAKLPERHFLKNGEI